MTTTPTETPYDWLKSMEPRLVNQKKLAIVEFPEEFSWEALSQAFAQHFEIPHLHLIPSPPTWLAEGSALQGLQAPTKNLRYAVGNFPGELHWIMTTDAATQLMTDLLSGQPGLLSVGDPAFLEGFLQYVAAETLQLLNPLGFREDLAPRLLGHDAEPPQGKVLSIDLQVAVFNSSYPMRLAISEPLAAAWKTYFMRLGRRQGLSEAVAHQTEILAHLESGHVTLSQKQWAAVNEGDFIILDSSTVTPGVEKGRVMLTVGGVPLFRCMLKSGQIKLLEHPLYHEVETPMSETEDSENNGYEDNESFAEQDEEENDEDDADLDEEADEDDLDEESHDDNEDADADEHAEDEPSNESTAVENHEKVVEEAQEERELTPAERIPLTIVIEVGRLKMSLSKLRDLQPGQLLDIDVKPEDGVDLVINGACVGRGELLRLGENLGVRILELG